MKDRTKVPALLVVTVPIVIPDKTRLPASVNAERLPVAEKPSSAFAPPVRTKVKVAPE